MCVQMHESYLICYRATLQILKIAINDTFKGKSNSRNSFKMLHNV